jgi:HK97 family phage prohead protease
MVTCPECGHSFDPAEAEMSASAGGPHAHRAASKLTAATTRREAAGLRRERFERDGFLPGAQVRSGVMMPAGAARRVSTRDMGAPSQLRAKKMEKDGKQFYVLEGYFTMYERGYEMWDWAGPYTEVVSAGAGERTIAGNPDVVFLINHSGLALARTAAGTLELWSDDTGGGNRAWLNPQRQDVKDLIASVEDGVTTEQSFAFMIEQGQWSPDYMEFRINDFEINRGDTSAVNYGANPYTSVAARSREILDALDYLPAGAVRVALDRLTGREDTPPPVTPPAPAPVEPPAATGRSVALLLAQLTAESD